MKRETKNKNIKFKVLILSKCKREKIILTDITYSSLHIVIRMKKVRKRSFIDRDDYQVIYVNIIYYKSI
jgi:1-aminocyclopropane-1-carboxylate deaminase/D-cysteine desulfhydrase-like pyridoxal-dependent ACC family enzyme